MLKDKLIPCPRCGSDVCYEQELSPDYKMYQCYGCGFTTNTLMHTDSQFLEEQLEVLPELYKDLVFVDENEYHWMPLAINLPNQGMVYADGTNTENWKWSAVKAVKINEEEKEKYPIPNKEGEYYEYKMDIKSLSKFAERDFMDALDYIGMFEKEK